MKQYYCFWPDEGQFLRFISPLNACAILQNMAVHRGEHYTSNFPEHFWCRRKLCSVSFYWPLCQNAYPTNAQREVEDNLHLVPSQLVLLDLFIFFWILLVFIGLSYLQELLQTKRLYATSYIGVIYLQKNKLLEKQ